MRRSPAKLYQAAKNYRHMAAECLSQEARQTLLDEADELEVEACNKDDLTARGVLLIPQFHRRAA